MRISSSDEIFLHFKQHPYISLDSRKTQPGSLFFALKGENFNGNQYAKLALEQGAAYAVIDDPEYYTGERTLLTSDTLTALQQLAADYRNTLNIPVIGITGTNGKTTSKELIFTALSTKFRACATSGNFNNHIGVPVTLLNIKPDTEIAIVEMGANHIGEIAALCRIARPTHGLITNIGKAHLEGFGSPEGVIKAKKELYDHLRKNGGTAFVHGNDHLLMQLSEELPRITYGNSGNEPFFGELIDDEPFLSVKLQKPLSLQIQTQLSGGYNFSNVMAAIAIAGHFRVNLNDAATALQAYEPKMNRSQVLQTGKNIIVLDAYNANPSSMTAAISNFSAKSPDKKVLILGDMFELGTASEQEHNSILELAVSCGFRRIITAGPEFHKAAACAVDVLAFLSVEDLRLYLLNNPLSGENILIKGSRGMKLETITDAL
ncbi:UDP-N-acetylmuramoyl-tripeptide--D-alanyl-D-alanine ligase [Lentimicrobium saccharophilum]|uniref:UDP-N-acetylmuramoyl-tripeptide--D-alanyl-D-alanine ligase n=1 Tax=Lentimicrobium saccharophilum TaxID=1678841 RepID=A0A0S7C556_9BACT|nr:UDP-N-acetylmuramoyl-tripeptide--D-alanyl-D-alanine ligase [Lentimicrobium saccharophilum]GAP45012.1 UDP-N-acetylmuramoyl-tripeptide--D-alanyl-D-alanine ligase [Lentimicrobium saccharophilum]